MTHLSFLYQLLIINLVVLSTPLGYSQGIALAPKTPRPSQEEEAPADETAVVSAPVPHIFTISESSYRSCYFKYVHQSFECPFDECFSVCNK
ncbi:BPTI/Kunitz inhibitor domain-containing protein [Caenorhabditis elegans]|uniref:BPTI/Kunitz inhibitor domain-containing protein n=1 Tax=Caenorhabditis elegans TaxID=6239 RepID=I2HAE2_CAEEL|nr:BPTI/Kunitz inhibitor domain-containing protein [Caenorhabditis elegans]CCH63849.1 BPTI/Kunitz inhibitor domain-containing protein [Caenorhabditis elegans]|eukprot:NP_001255560.1 Uncharacterized protein CELE_H21P03.10 [Caenorhabditis elegans]